MDEILKEKIGRRKRPSKRVEKRSQESDRANKMKKDKIKYNGNGRWLQKLNITKSKLWHETKMGFPSSRSLFLQIEKESMKKGIPGEFLIGGILIQLAKKSLFNQKMGTFKEIIQLGKKRKNELYAKIPRLRSNILLKMKFPINFEKKKNNLVSSRVKD